MLFNQELINEQNRQQQLLLEQQLRQVVLLYCTCHNIYFIFIINMIDLLKFINI